MSGFPHLDADDVALRHRTIKVGGLLALSVLPASLIADPRNPASAWLLCAIAVIAAVSTQTVAWQRLLRSRAAELSVAGWASTLIVLAGGAAATDGGISSPLTVMLLPALAYVALLVPVRSLGVVGTVTACVFAALIVLDQPMQAATIAPLGLAASMTVGLSAWYRHSLHNQRSTALRVQRTDPATGTLNRAGLHERLATELAAADRTGRAVAVVTIDVTHTHIDSLRSAEDDAEQLLISCASSLRSVLRPSDALGRTDTATFTLIAPTATRAHARRIASRVRKALGDDIEVGIGIATFPEDGATPSALTQAARLSVSSLPTLSAVLFGDRQTRSGS